MYKEYSPCNSLSPFIDKYWEFKGQPEYGMRINILPDGCTDFIFTLGEVANAVDGNLIMQPYRSYFVGPMTTYSELVTYAKNVHMLGIRFHPCGLFRFMEMPLHELTNQRISTDDLATLFHHSFAEQLCEMSNIHQRIGLIESFLIYALYKCTPKTEQKIQYAVERINQHNGTRSVRSISEEICLCERQFERKFKLFTGFSPKEYSRIVKFKNAINLLRNTSFDSMLSVAIHAGYYDLPHFSKEIKKLSGNTPGSFLSQHLPEEVALTYIES